MYLDSLFWAETDFYFQILNLPQLLPQLPHLPHLDFDTNPLTGSHLVTEKTLIKKPAESKINWDQSARRCVVDGRRVAGCWRTGQNVYACSYSDTLWAPRELHGASVDHLAAGGAAETNWLHVNILERLFLSFTLIRHVIQSTSRGNNERYNISLSYLALYVIMWISLVRSNTVSTIYRLYNVQWQ